VTHNIQRAFASKSNMFTDVQTLCINNIIHYHTINVYFIRIYSVLRCSDFMFLVFVEDRGTLVSTCIQNIIFVPGPEA
jgi:hypothetical protein